MSLTLRLHRSTDSSGGRVTFLGSNWQPAEFEFVIQACQQHVKQTNQYGRAWDCIIPAVSMQSIKTSDTATSSTSTTSSVPPTEDYSKVCLLPHLFLVNYYLAKVAFKEALESFQLAEKVFAYGNSQQKEGDEQVWTPREKYYMAGFRAMLQGDLKGAIAEFERILVDDVAPNDLFVVKKVQLLYFFLGDRRGMLTVCQRHPVANACRDLPYFNGMLAFGYEENGDLGHARELSLRALEIDPEDVWAQHVMAHVFYEQGEVKEGIRWMEERAHIWRQCMSFMYTHNYFHLALLYTDADDYQRVAEIFDTHIWPASSTVKDDYHSTSSGVSAITLGTVSSLDDLSTSFGVPVTPKSFPTHDLSYPEDANAALNMLWRFEIRTKIGKMKSNAAPIISSSTPLAASPFMNDSSNWFATRWASAIPSITPPSDLTTLFGLLQLHALYRCSKLDDAEKAYYEMRTKVLEMPNENEQKIKLMAILLPLAEAVKAIYTDADPNHVSGYKRAFQLLQPIFDPHIRDVAITNFAASKPTLSATSSSSSSSSIQSSIDLLPVCSSPPPLMSQPSHLSCLGASGEQLEVLIEFWFEVCLRASEYGALLRTFSMKDAARRTQIGWYARLETEAEENFYKLHPYELHYNYHVDAWTKEWSEMKVKDVNGAEYGIHRMYGLLELSPVDVDLLIRSNHPSLTPNSSEFESLRNRIESFLACDETHSFHQQTATPSQHHHEQQQQPRRWFFKLSSRSPKDLYPMYVYTSQDVIKKCRESERLQEDLLLHQDKLKSASVASSPSSPTPSLYLCFQPWSHSSLTEYRCFVYNGRLLCVTNIQSARLDANEAFATLPPLRELIERISSNPRTPQFYTCSLDVWHYEDDPIQRVYVMEPNELDPLLDCHGYIFEEIQQMIKQVKGEEKEQKE